MNKSLFSLVGLLAVCFVAQGQDNASPNFESFESASTPSCWASIDADGDTYPWELVYQLDDGQGGFIPGNTGDGMMISASYDNTVGALTPDNFLVLPKLSIQAGEHLSYYVGAFDPNWAAEKYAVVLSTGGTNPEDFTVNLFEETLASADWSERFVDLSNYEGQEVYLAFRHYDITDQFVLSIDDVTYPTVVENCEAFVSVEEVADEVSVALYPNPSNGVVNLEFSNVDFTSVEIMNSLGQVIENFDLSNQQTLTISDLASGVYIARVQGDNVTVEKRFVVE